MRVKARFRAIMSDAFTTVVTEAFHIVSLYFTSSKQRHSLAPYNGIPGGLIMTSLKHHLLIGAALSAFAVPGAAQTAGESQAQAANQGASTTGQDGEITVGDVIRKMAADGITEATALVLAPRAELTLDAHFHRLERAQQQEQLA